MKLKKKHKPQRLKPKPVPVYTLPPTNILHRDVGLIINCPICGTTHPHGLQNMLVDKPIKMNRTCKVWDRKPRRAMEFVRLEYKRVGPVPPKYRLKYSASDIASCDTAISNAELKRARAANKKAEKRDRRTDRERRAALRTKTQNDSYGASATH